MPKIKYIDRRFGEDALAVIAFANQLVAQYQAQDLVLTLRQAYYRFVAAGKIPNTERSYKRVGSILNDARLAGLIDWEAIEDRGRNLQEPARWGSPGRIIRAAANSYALDKWEGQERRVEIWVEKQALESVVGQAAEPLNCPYYACKGYVSQSELWRAAMRLKGYEEADQEPVIIHLGDHDPSGIDMTRDIEDRLKIFGVHPIVRRIALNMDQVQKYNPPPNPAKQTDARFAGYVEKYGDESWELDALEPATLRELITETVEEYLDRERFEEIEARQEEERTLLVKAADSWPKLARRLAGKDA